MPVARVVLTSRYENSRSFSSAMTDHALSASRLSWRQRISPPGERVTAALELQPQGCTLQVQCLSKGVHQITPIVTGKPVETITVNDDDWRMPAALVRIAQANSSAADEWWRMSREGPL